jgi:hypothetical protein
LENDSGKSFEVFKVQNTKYVLNFRWRGIKKIFDAGPLIDIHWFVIVRKKGRKKEMKMRLLTLPMYYILTLRISNYSMILYVNDY